MGDEIRDPNAISPSPSFCGGVIAGLIYLGTTLSMLVAMPQKEIGVLSGILQAINLMSTRTNLLWIVAPLALLECLAILGTASAWFSGAARLPFRRRSRSLPPAHHRQSPSPLPHPVRKPDPLRDTVIVTNCHQLFWESP